MNIWFSQKYRFEHKKDHCYIKTKHLKTHKQHCVFVGFFYTMNHFYHRQCITFIHELVLNTVKKTTGHCSLQLIYIRCWFFTTNSNSDGYCIDSSMGKLYTKLKVQTMYFINVVVRITLHGIVKYLLYWSSNRWLKHC